MRNENAKLRNDAPNKQCWQQNLSFVRLTFLKIYRFLNDNQGEGYLNYSKIFRNIRNSDILFQRGSFELLYYEFIEVILKIFLLGQFW